MPNRPVSLTEPDAQGVELATHSQRQALAEVRNQILYELGIELSNIASNKPSTEAEATEAEATEAEATEAEDTEYDPIPF